MFDKFEQKVERGQVGISFLIVFIALVLVAAIAAGLFIQSAGVLEQQASSTGEDARSEVSNQIEVVDAYGVDTNGTDGTASINKVELTVERAAGSNAIDLDGATIDYFSQDSQDFFQYNTSASASSPGGFTVTTVQEGGSTDATVLDADNDVKTVNIFLSSSQELSPGEEATVTINTAEGGEKTVLLEAPTNFDDGATVEL